MNFTAETTLIELFYHWEKATPDKVFLRQPFGDQFKDFTWHEAGQQARRLASTCIPWACQRVATLV